MKRFLISALLLSSLLAAACSSTSGSKANDTAAPTDPPAATAPTGTEPVLGDDGVAVDCPILEGGLCYQTMEAAAKSIGKDPAQCVVMEIYPGQLSCE